MGADQKGVFTGPVKLPRPLNIDYSVLKQWRVPMFYMSPFLRSWLFECGRLTTFKSSCWTWFESAITFYTIDVSGVLGSVSSREDRKEKQEETDVAAAALSAFCGKVKVLGYILFHTPSQRFVLVWKAVAASCKTAANKNEALVWMRKTKTIWKISGTKKVHGQCYNMQKY